MADFLTNLVAKNLSVAPVLLPRVPALYEPWQGSVGRELQPRSHAPFEERSEVEATGLSARLRIRESTESQLREPATRKPDLKPADSPRSPLISELRAVDPNAMPTPLERVIPLAEPSSLGTRSTHLAERQIDTRQMVFEPAAKEAPATETLRVERVIIQQEATNAVAASSSLAARDQVAGEPAVEESPTAPVRENIPRQDKTAEADARIPSFPMLLPRPLPQLIPTQPAEPAFERINVTIGRIEVRSVTPRPEPKTTRAPQVSTLADYLRGSSRR